MLLTSEDELKRIFMLVNYIEEDSKFSVEIETTYDHERGSDHVSAIWLKKRGERCWSVTLEELTLDYLVWTLK